MLLKTMNGAIEVPNRILKGHRLVRDAPLKITNCNHVHSRNE